jgi:hypothetical protein
MEMMLAVANENRNPVSVDKLPKGSKVTHFVLYHEGTFNILGRGRAATAKQATKQMDRLMSLGMKADLALYAEDGDRTVLLRETYILKRTGPEKV